MSLSPVLAVAQMIQAQANKDVTLNDHLKAVEQLAGYLAKSIAGGAGTTNLTAIESRSGVIELTGALTGNRVVNFPAGFDHAVVLINNTTGTSFTVTVTWNAGTGTIIPRGCAVPVRKSGAASTFDFRAGMIRLPEVIASRGSNTQALTNNAETVVQFNAENRDTAESFDSTTNWRFTAPAAGLYQVDATVEVDISGAVAGSYNGHAAIRVNGTVIRRGEQSNTGLQAAGTTCRHNVSAMVQLAAADTLDVVFSNAHTAGTLVVDFGAEKTYFQLNTIRFGT